jgi:hypothetical protein
MVSPSLIDSVGHSGMHAPHEMHSSVIFIAIVIFSFFGLKSGILPTISKYSV